MFDLETLITTVGLLGVAGIIFAETGLLIGFFLPGDSLLFTAGFLASQGFASIGWLMILAFIGAVAGNSTGYAIGHRYGRKLFQRPDSRWFKHENLEQAEAFYAKHGAKTIILAQFIPIVRTFAPVIAGIGSMSYPKFIAYNIIGAVFWAGGVPMLGYWLGSKIPGIDRYLLPVIALIILLSIMPGILHFLRQPTQRQNLWRWLRSFGKKS